MYGLFHWSELELTFLYAIAMQRPSLLVGLLDFYVKFVVIKGTTLVEMGISLKEQTKNNLEDVKDQTLMLGKVGDK